MKKELKNFLLIIIVVFLGIIFWFMIKRFFFSTNIPYENRIISTTYNIGKYECQEIFLEINPGYANTFIEVFASVNSPYVDFYDNLSLGNSTTVIKIIKEKNINCEEIFKENNMVSLGYVNLNQLNEPRIKLKECYYIPNQTFYYPSNIKDFSETISYCIHLKRILTKSDKALILLVDFTLISFLLGIISLLKNQSISSRIPR